MSAPYRIFADREGIGYAVVGPSVWLFDDILAAVAFSFAMERMEAEVAFEARKSVMIRSILSPAQERRIKQARPVTRRGIIAQWWKP